MKKYISILVVPVLVFSGYTIAGGPPDIVVGGARFDLANDAKVEIMAKSDADGTNAQGRFRLRQGNIDITGEVTCLAVWNNWASAGGVIVYSSNASDIGKTFFQVTRDNGEGWDDSDESQSILHLHYADPNSCADHIAFDPSFNVDRGNYEIKDR